MESQVQLSQQHPPFQNLTPRHQAFKTSCGVFEHQPTCLPNCICTESTTTKGTAVVIPWNRTEHLEKRGKLC